MVTNSFHVMDDYRRKLRVKKRGSLIRHSIQLDNALDKTDKINNSIP